ncbi:OmpA family protein [Falsiroseomonas oryziterrae]|uniref:OmpA family protein n=1 Tax=Falsiroseomonas oryziterrae TaxID=2911368 RepID=UPI001F4375F1|nr:OmpA family protein [Roseomonas sp. NPKOSM-4]
MPPRHSLLTALLLAASPLALPVASHAQPVRGLYVGAGVGFNWMTDSDISFTGRGTSAANASGTASFDRGFSGFVGVASVGYAFANGLRAEAELNFRQNDVNQISGLGFPGRSGFSGGAVFSWGVMANVLYDLHLGWPVVPYVGAGIGVVSQNWDNVRQSSRANPADFYHIVGTEAALAYQGILGLAYPLQALPGLSLTAEYRLFGAAQESRDAVRYFASGDPRVPGSAETDNLHHSLLFGVRYAFGAARSAPAATPAAAPAPARSFLVFFDWDRAELTERARQVVAEAASSAQRGGVTRIEVAGHADRSGTPQYNQRLSERRAQAVAAELERRGIPRSAMTIQAFGETRPLVPTADGAREPQNRRVEIVLR